MSVKTFAAIDVGSFELTMKIYEFSGKDSMREIDKITKRLDLGSDTFFHGKIRSEKIDELCKTLMEFEKIMKSYKVDAYKAYGTSAMRESDNLAIILDQIALRTGIRVEILSNSEQRFLDYKSAASRDAEFKKTIEEKTAILDIGGGSIQLSLFDNDTLVSTQNLMLGVLRVQEYLTRFDVRPSNLENFVTEMAMAQLSNYKKLYLKDREIKTLIVIDDYVSPWAMKKTSGEVSKSVAEMEEFKALCMRLRSESPMRIAAAFGIGAEKIPLMRISACLIEGVADLMGVSQIRVPGVTLCDGIAYEYAEKNNLVPVSHDFERDIVACAMNISKRYMGSRKRAETLENISLTIFDSMKKVHGLGKRERLYLRLAAILHDCGKYLSMMNIGENSYSIIMATEMIGLSHQERMIVASIARYYHTKFDYYGRKDSELDSTAYLTVAKLTAILRVAGGLDRSHKQKMKELKAQLKDNTLILTVESGEDITLEKGFFEEKKDFFLEVFSIEPVLKQKKTF